jgi:MBG domain-containing protein/concanavalin A-like lectin/glucanase superfamily protein/YDG domain-containing protein/Big-like domain-containing protein
MQLKKMIMTALLFVVSCAFDGSVLAAFPNRVAYVHSTDIAVRDSYQTFLTSNGVAVDLVDLAAVATYDFSVDQAILIGYDTSGYFDAIPDGYNWGTTAAINHIKGAGKPIIGLGFGGASFFSQLGLSLGWGQGSIDTTGTESGIIAVDPTSALFTSPNTVQIDTGNSVTMFTVGTPFIAIYAPALPGVVAYGQHQSWPQYYQLIEQPDTTGSYFLWGFNGSPATMTLAGKNLFLNTLANFVSPCVLAPSGLVSWWKGNGNSLDGSNTNNATMANPSSFAIGKNGQAFSFDGFNDYLTIPASTSLNVGAATGNSFTLTAWIKPEDIINQQPLFEWSGGQTGVHFWTSVPGGSGSGSLYANIADTSGSGHAIYSPSGILTANSYQHVALTYDYASGTAALYLNGAALNLNGGSVKSISLGQFIPRTDSNLYIGTRPGILKFAGAMDDLQLYNRALSPAEINAIYGNSLHGLCSVPDTIPPVDGTVTAVPYSSSEIYLYWNNFADGNSGLAATNTYKVVRADASSTAPIDCSGTAIYQGTATYLYDTPLSTNTQFAYRVCAMDAAGNLSIGAIASATTKQSFTLTTATTGTGGASGTVSPASGVFDAGYYAYLYAYPDANSVFDFWSGDCSGTYASVSLYIDANKSCTANFAPLPTPQVIATQPATGTVIEDVTTAAITAEFNVPLLKTSIDATTFVVKDQNGATVAGSVTYDSYFKQVTFTPDALLAGGATYTATLTTGIQNAIGTPLAAEYSWSFTVAPYLGGVASEGNLLVTPLNDGRIGVYRYIAGDWQNQMFSWDNKGSRLQVNGNGTTLGYFNLVEIDALPSLVSNAQVNSTQTRTEWTTTDGLRLIQELLYQPGAAYYGLTWKIANESAADMTDLRFFHGEDTYFLGSDQGAGFWDAPNNTIGVQRTYGTDLRRMSLQAITVPSAYDSEYYGNVSSNVSAGALPNTIDPSESTDNGYALEWENPTLAAGSTWAISAFEKFADVPVGAVSVTAPVTTTCDAGTTCSLTYTITNTTTSSANVTLSLSSDQTGWSATTSTTSFGILASGSQQVAVQLTIPAGVADGLIGHLTLSANDGTATASDTAAVHVRNIVTPTAATISLSNMTQAYDKTPKAVSVTTSPPGLSVNITYNGSTTVPTNAGSYAVVATITETNYTGSANGTLTITQKPLAVTATGVNKVYDGNNTATVSYGDDRLAGDTLTVTGTAVFSNKTAGVSKSISVTAITITGTDSANYSLAATSTTATANILSRPLTASVSCPDKTYDGSTTATVTFSDDRLTGDTLTVTGTAVFADKNSGLSKPVAITGIAITGTDASNYSLTTSAATTTANITAAPLSATGLSAGSKVYDGLPGATLTGGSLTGVLGTDQVTIVGSYGTFSDKNAGSGKPVTVSSVILTGPDAGNYAVTGPVGIISDITPAPLVITANSFSKIYGQTHTFSGTEFTATGLQNGETIGSVTLSSTGDDSAATISDGPYPVTASAATGGTFTPGNYSITYKTGLLSVTQSTVTITATATAGGIITPAGTTTVNLGANQAYSITPGAGYYLTDLKVDGISQGALSSYTFNSVTVSHTIEAQFFKPDGVLDPANTTGVPLIHDAVIALTFALGETTPTPEQLRRCDAAPMVNGIPHPDGKVDLADVLIILRKVVGLIN